MEAIWGQGLRFAFMNARDGSDSELYEGGREVITLSLFAPLQCHWEIDKTCLSVN